MRKKKPRKKPSLPATQSQQIIDRCLSAIEHVKDGLSALKLFPEPEIQNQDCNSVSKSNA